MISIYLYILVFQQTHDIAMKYIKKTVCLDCHGNVKFKAMVLKLI